MKHILFIVITIASFFLCMALLASCIIGLGYVMDFPAYQVMHFMGVTILMWGVSIVGTIFVGTNMYNDMYPEG